MFKNTLALAAGIALSVSAVFAQAADVLKVSAIPDEAPTELLRKFKPLGAYLEQELGMKVEFVPVADYAAVVEALAADRIDMAWLGGFTFVQARLKTGNAVPLVQREQDAEFTSKFITSDPAVKSPQDLKGKTFAFGSVSSTSGSLMPRYFMLQDGIKPEDFFSRVAYSGAHDATAAWVQAGKADAGVLNASRPGLRWDWSDGPADDPPPARCRLPVDPVEPHAGQMCAAVGAGRASRGEPRRTVSRCQCGDALPGQYRGGA